MGVAEVTREGHSALVEGEDCSVGSESVPPVIRSSEEEMRMNIFDLNRSADEHRLRAYLYNVRRWCTYYRCDC